MGKREFLVGLDRRAPAKPDQGRPCNGCGACCAAAPCPLGMILGRNLRGRCVRLVWDETATRYVCGLVAGTAPWPAWARGLARRWIGAGVGCDFAAEVVEDHY